MRTPLLLPLALVAALGACSGDSTSNTVFTDPIAAMDAGDSAKAASDYAAAKAGYDYALANGDDSLKGEAMTGLLEVDVAANDETAAIASFDRLSKEFASSLTQEEIARLVDVAVNAKMAALGETMLGYAVSTYPDMKASLAQASAALAKIRTEGPGADLSSLGYANE